MKHALLKINIGFTGKKVIIIALSAVVLLVFWSLLFNRLVTPSFDELFASIDRWRIAEQIYIIKEKNLSELESNKQQLTAIDAVENSRALIPGTAQAPEALIALRHELDKNRIEETGFYIEPPENYALQALQEESVTRQYVTIMGVGGYTAILNYIDAIADAEYFYKPNSYELTSRGSLKRNSVHLTAKYTLFVLKERSDLSATEIQYENPQNPKNPFYNNP